MIAARVRRERARAAAEVRARPIRVWRWPMRMAPGAVTFFPHSGHWVEVSGKPVRSKWQERHRGWSSMRRPRRAKTRRPVGGRATARIAAIRRTGDIWGKCNCSWPEGEFFSGRVAGGSVYPRAW